MCTFRGLWFLIFLSVATAVTYHELHFDSLLMIGDRLCDETQPAECLSLEYVEDDKKCAVFVGSLKYCSQ
jgi:hypothetical protein